MEYTKAPEEVTRLVSEIAKAHHDRLNGLCVAVLMQEKATRKSGKVALATASLPPNRLRPLLEDDVAFVICIGLDTWLNLNEPKRRAVIDHELCHCGVDAEGEPYIRPHDYEEFGEVAERHGFWRGTDPGEVHIQMAFSGIVPQLRVTTLAGKERATA